MGELAKKALKAIREQGGRVVNHDLLDSTLREIGSEYRPGLLAWIRTEYRHSLWEEMFALEDAINKATLAGDRAALDAALQAYRLFFKEMSGLYEESERLPLFRSA